VIDTDRIVCDYPLRDPAHQHREFTTGDLGGWGRRRYTITRDGRLIRNAPARREELAPVKDVEWPIEGEIMMVADDVPEEEGPVEYRVLFRDGRVEWIRRVRLDPPEDLASPPPSARGSLVPDVMGRPASPEDFRSLVPRKLELVDGHIPGEERLVLLLLATMGLRRVAALVGRERWLSAVEEQG
jgi:hypothetical protein